MARFCQECGHALELKDVEGRPLPACPACGWTRWPDPKLVTITVVETPAGLVFGRRGIEPGYGGWCMPGGFVNDDEHPAVSAARECMEEVHAEVAIDRLIGIYHAMRGDGQGMVALAYAARALDPRAITAGHEMLEVVIAAPDQAPELVFSLHRRALRDWVESTA
ncbi:MAG TPA: NUDIX hydrolase [Candidatus Dormibacteraeota bacterium]